MQAKRGRPPGRKNSLPSKERLEMAFSLSGFSFVEEYIKHYRESDGSDKTKLLIGITEYLYPKRRAEDSTGNPGELTSPIVVTEEFMLKAVAKARESK